MSKSSGVSDIQLTFRPKAKLRVLHEVVVRNRLEQLRKRQRDEALQAQEELLAGVVRNASKGTADMPVESVQAEEDVLPEDLEPYHRSMSPTPINIAKLLPEERQIPVISAADDRRKLVCLSSSGRSAKCLILSAISWSNGDLSLVHDSFPRLLVKRPKKRNLS